MDAGTSRAPAWTGELPLAAAEPASLRERCAAVAAALLVHGLIAVAAVGLVATPVPPEQIVVELVAETGQSAGSAAGDAPAGNAGTQAVAATASQAQPPAAAPAAAVREKQQPPAPRAQKVLPAKPAAKRQMKSAMSPEPTPAVEEPKPAEATISVAQPAAAEDGRSVTAMAAEESGSGQSGNVAGGDAAGANGGGVQGGNGKGGGRAGGSALGYTLGSAANPMPAYPPAARRRGTEGEVVLRVVVSADGRARSVEVIRSSGSELLDQAARNAIARWHFRPARRNGEAVEGTATIPVRFALVDG